jgi:hypothetical protein
LELSPDGYADEAQPVVRITVDIAGSGPTKGLYKGYAYFPKGIPKAFVDDIVSSLDGTNAVSGETKYVHLEANWYLWELY